MQISVNHIKNALKRYFGHSDFRPGQEETVDAVLAGRDTLTVLPTGGGKSLCYQLPAVLMKGAALVISPLIALMKDQVDALQKAGIPATYINSSIPVPEINRRLIDAMKGQFKLIYIAPERLESRTFLDQLVNIDVSFLVVDEAHCISQWGHDFRPAYLRISRLTEHKQIRSVSALTATATPEVQDDIVRNLQMKDALRIVKGFDRPNLSYLTKMSDDKAGALSRELRSLGGGVAIVYAGTRKRVEEISMKLRENRFDATPYHAGLPPPRRKQVQDIFIRGKAPVIVATNAFGMGIDKPDVRKVIHLDMTLTLEAYYQEAGRAGRDGRPSDCMILYHPRDRRLMEFFIESNYPSADVVEKVYNFICDSAGIGLGAASRRPIFLEQPAIANRLNMPVGAVSSAISLLSRNEIIAANSGLGRAAMQFTTSSERLGDYMRNTSPERRKVLEALLRSLSSEALQKPVEADINRILQKHFIKPEEFRRSIEAFEYARIVKYIPSTPAGGFFMKKERMEFDRLPVNFSGHYKRKAFAYRKLDMMESYIHTSKCKNTFILEYFGEKLSAEDCGRCSSCRRQFMAKPRLGRRDEKYLKAIISAAWQLDGRFGRKALLDFLLGNEIAGYHNAELSRSEFFGTAKRAGKLRLGELIDRALHEQLVCMSEDEYPRIEISDDGKKYLGINIRPVRLRKIALKQNPALYEALIKARDGFATEFGIVPRAIASNRAISKIAQLMPTDKKELAGLPGIGPVFVARFGDKVLRIISDFRSSAPQSAVESLPDDVKKAVKYVNSGKSLDSIAAKMNTTEGIAAHYIQRAIEAGVELNLKNLADNELIDSIIGLLQANPHLPLREIRNRLDSEEPYPRLRVAVALARRKLKE